MEADANYMALERRALPNYVLERVEEYWAKNYESEYGYLFKSVEGRRE